MESDIAVVEFCYGNPLKWSAFTVVGPDRSEEYTYSEELIGITGIRVRYLKGEHDGSD